ncbi:PAS domain S-box protein [Natronococcus sp. A-GB1]|uniref:PAS domain S-box protein n=1 Tax=Natronococcus sp. A-GB1 TaxID=3037648 RepID=UPI00241FC643|nr:PAS domain S-box protein [Natronococcus sp. A-GB1]MDG5760517.1 PAS domain S-box protein [Natronococcus sp. A-GB1]
MDAGLEVDGARPVRVLVVGTEPWAETVTTTVEDRNGFRTITGDESATVLERADTVDCVLTNDRTAVQEIDGRHPVVYVADDVLETDVEELLADGATDVVGTRASERPALLERRLRLVASDSPNRAAIGDDEAWHRSLLECSSDLLLVFDPSGRLTYASPGLERVTGLEPSEFGSARLFEGIHPEDRATVDDSLDTVRTDPPGETRTVTYRYRGEDGWRVHEAVLTNLLEDPVVDGVVASIRDVTRSHRVERDLSESFERVSDAFYALDTDWRFTYVNSRAEELLGRPRSELLGADVRELFPHGSRSELFDRFADAMERQERISWERYSESLEIWMEIHAHPSETGLSVHFRDITDRIEREQELTERTERLRMVIENAPVIHYVIDTEGTVTLSEGRGLDNIGFEAADAVGDSFFELFDEYPAIRADARAALEGESVHGQRRILDRVFDSWYRPIVEDGEVTRVIGVAIDVTERVQYREALSTLHEATSHLLTVDSKDDACEYIVAVADDVLDLDSIVFRFDEQRNELEPAAYSSDLERAIGTPPRFEPNEGITWETFVTGTPSVFEDVRESELVYDESTNVRSGLYIPLGEHGVFAAVSTVTDQYDEDTVELVKLFATTAKAALDRIGRTRRLHENEQELKQQNRYLEQVNESKQVRQNIEEHLLRADSRETIERAVCTTLAETEHCSFAWIGEPDPSGSRIRPRSHAGLERGYLEAVTVTAVDDSAAEPAGRAVRTRRPVAVDNVADSVGDGSWRTDALSRNFQSVISVPLVYDGHLYGVLSAYGDDPNALDDPFGSMLTDLCDSIAYTMDAVKRKNALLEERVTEVELELGAESPLCRFADQLDHRVAFEGATLQDDGSTLAFASLEPPIDSENIDTSVDGIDDPVVLTDSDQQTLVQLRITGPFLGRIVADHGATLRELVSDDSGHRAVVDLPAGLELRTVLSDITRHGLSASMVARRDRPSGNGASLEGPARKALLDRLTARQQEVVRTAYHSGFFEWPRQTTGEAVADSLSISPPAFHKHVRSAERKLFATLFEGVTTDG